MRADDEGFINNAFQSTLLMRGATDSRAYGPRETQEISIHAPHARSDSSPGWFGQQRYNFNPRSSCEERLDRAKAVRVSRNFNPRSSCEERRYPRHSRHTRRYFNPRSSCEERRYRSNDDRVGAIFQSTLLMRGATGVDRLRFRVSNLISIHAPHARSDVFRSHRTTMTTTFQSTLLMRGATLRLAGPPKQATFQSTLLMRGATWKKYAWYLLSHFNPRSSCEERQCHFQALICLTSS